MSEFDPESLLHDHRSSFAGFHALMPHRAQRVLLVSSLYDLFVLEEDGQLIERIATKYLDLNLTYVPNVTRANNGAEALQALERQPFDLIITMAYLGDMDALQFAQHAQAVAPLVPIILLAHEARDLSEVVRSAKAKGVDRVFVWSGDTQLFLAIMKYFEDRLNVEHDTRVGDVRVILLIENSVHFYSVYLPLLYTEVMEQTYRLLAEGLDLPRQLLRMRARPKILLADRYEEAWELFSQYRDHLLGIISDIRFPREGKLASDAGLEFIRKVREQVPDMPVLLQSSDMAHARAARELGAAFLHKRSPTLLLDLREFMLTNFGFGDFVFRLPDGTEVARASDLRTMEHLLAVVPDESLRYHGSLNHFSNWLRARTEFDLAARIRPRKVTEFATPEDLRRYLIDAFAGHRRQTQRGMVAEFSRERFDAASAFVRIGRGSLGGKARGLAFVNSLLTRYDIRQRFDGVDISVPRSAVIGTDVFDAFLHDNHLHDLVFGDVSDDRIVQAFMEAKLPPEIYSDLTAFLEQVDYPLAVRSSSLLEDSPEQPFAGVYATHMIPNNHQDVPMRRDQLCDAIKLVYASTFFRSAKLYLQATEHRPEEEKMAVILQQIVGRQYDNHFYPCISGVARSYNFYPFAHLRPQDGVAYAALGLGMMVVEGGQALRFCPTHPSVLPQLSTPDDFMNIAQRKFYAVDMTRPDDYPSPDTLAYISTLNLDVAERDGTLAPIGSVYSAENDAIYDGIFRPGTRLVTFAHVLKSGLFPLAEIIKLLLDVCRWGMNCPVEIEFAVSLNPPAGQRKEFGFLQVRPLVGGRESADVTLDGVLRREMLCRSEHAMGNGRIQGIQDVVYVKPEAFDPANTSAIADQVARMNESLRQAGRPYVLIGPGRWGSRDPWLGIPVAWAQISGARVIVETNLKDFLVTPSQGTHFFQNLAAFQVGYLTINQQSNDEFVDWAWLSHRPTADETQYLRHVHLRHALEVRLHGRAGHAAILKRDHHP
jgi:CheY-like chemotaxis protein